MAKDKCACNCCEEEKEVSFCDVKQWVYDLSEELGCTVNEALKVIEAYYDGWIQEAYKTFGGAKGNPPNEEGLDEDEKKFCYDEDDEPWRAEDDGTVVSTFQLRTDKRGRLRIKKDIISDLDVYQFPNDDDIPDGIMLAKDYDTETVYLHLGTDPDDFEEATEDRELAICWYRDQVSVNDVFGPDADVEVKVYDNGVCTVTRL